MKCNILHESPNRLRVHLHCTRMSLHEADLLEYYLRSVDGVTEVTVYDRTQDAVVRYTGQRSAVIGALASFSFAKAEVMELVPEHTSRALNREFEDKLAMTVMRRIFSKLFLPAPITTAMALYRSVKYIREGLTALWHGKLTVAVLDATAVTVSMVRGDFSTAGSVMFMLRLGEILEEWTHKKSVADLAGAMSLNVDKVWLQRGDTEVLVPIGDVQLGDRMLVRTGNLIPLDGQVVSGEAMVNQASITGESMPVVKRPGSPVYAGTVAEEGQCVVEVQKVQGSGRYDRIVRMIEESEKLKSTTEDKAARLADRLVPYTLGGTVLTYLLTRNVTKMLAVLMVDFSCALKLSMPIAVLSAMRECSSYHISVKGGRFLEAVAQADTVVFDKTGTLTYAVPTVQDVVPFGGHDAQEMLRLAACLEEHYPHSMATAVVEEAKRRGVALCMDCRNHSMEFARAAAEVCAANGIHVRIFESLRPTPELSFAVREYDCQAGINVTASHNPKEYNGYKVYWSDGAQLPPHHADAIAKRLEGIDIFGGVKRMDFEEAVKSGLIETMGDETDRKFMANVTAMINDRETVAKVADTFKLVYTPFHGCGYKLVPEALTALGIKHLIPVPEQMVIDGNFPTVVSPNPENPEGFYLAIDLAKKNDVDFILGTDPDSDRVGIMVRNHEGEFQPVTGNQTGVLLLDYLIGALKRSGKMPANPVALKTIVTTEMARKVAESNGVKCFDTFTGFKFMAEKKNALEESGEGKVIFSYEESYGYMLGDYVRDKDAVTASMLLTEMAAWYDAQGMTLFDALNALYEKYGWYAEKTHNLVMPGLDGLRDMAKLMKDLRENPPAEISSVKVIVRKDYTDGSVIDCVTGAKSRMELSGSNVLRYELEDGTVILVRPSGTEPKIKVYTLTQGADAAAANANLEKYGQWVAALKP